MTMLGILNLQIFAGCVSMYVWVSVYTEYNCISMSDLPVFLVGESRACRDEIRGFRAETQTDSRQWLLLRIESGAPASFG